MYKENIYELVEKFFSLDEESLAMFKEGLFNPDIDDVYKNFGLDSDLRKYWKIDRKDFEKYDKAWEYFKKEFPSFVKKTSITYEDFKDNKVLIDKNRVKLFKALVNFYLVNEEDIRLCHEFGYKGREIELLDIEEGTSYVRSISDFGFTFLTNYNDSRRDLQEGFEEKIGEAYEKYVSSVIERALNIVGSRKLPDKDIYLVLSLNFADWLFCSTGDSWTSCLSLKSDYSYWGGLPSLVVDKNRAMLYLTTREKKLPFENSDYIFKDGSLIKDMAVDKLLCRSWLFLSNEDLIKVLPSYPVSMLENEDMLKITGSDKFRVGQDFFSKRSKRLLPYLSKHPINLMYFTSGSSLSVYLDDMRLVYDGAPDKAIYEFKGGGISYFDKDSNRHFDGSALRPFEGGLVSIISLNTTTEQLLRKAPLLSCCCCNDPLEQGREFLSSLDNEYYCEYCYNDTFTYCEKCDADLVVEAIDTYYNFTTGGYLCCDCYDEFVKNDGG